MSKAERLWGAVRWGAGASVEPQSCLRERLPPTKADVKSRWIARITLAMSRASPVTTSQMAAIAPKPTISASRIDTERGGLGISRQPVKHGDPEKRSAEKWLQRKQFGCSIRRHGFPAELYRKGHQPQAGKSHVKRR